MRRAGGELWMTERQHHEFTRLSLPFGGLWGRPLHAIDCQGLFCETDKYCRAAAPELASARKRIKARFTPTPSRSGCSSRPSGASTASCPASRCSAIPSQPRTSRRPCSDPSLTPVPAGRAASPIGPIASREDAVHSPLLGDRLSTLAAGDAARRRYPGLYRHGMTG
jgi:alpha-glutamyl/putrescinyl thymine pyrophosphorylase clade 1